ncbi:PD-(D/E)XK motif protein [Arthrobacter sp. efr-133-R2A-63]|uniref:PD-(D/E)XK motif protein n=1 Tax=Arthrobacter sp. efr-133-R2A-63 TaxID=3040278 RepID=UPI002550614A|nr:PD-(D/E)XK motif protein [Arthrobacter sp. efr-133-R2A-63]
MTVESWTPERWQTEVCGGLVTLRELDPMLATRMVYGADEVGRLSFGLITHQPPGLPQLSDAVTIVRAEREHDGTWILLLTLEDARFSEVFMQLCGHVHKKVSESMTESAGISTAMECFAEWRHLFQGSRKRLLSMEECRGLFAELDFGFNVLGQRVGSSLVVEGWQGPYGSDQDFQFVDVHYEVKSRHASTHALRIASEYQLDGDSIVLVSVEVADSAKSLLGFTSLADKVVLARESVALDDGDLEAFDSALDELGFDPSEEFYGRIYFSSRGLDFYTVSDEFPRIRPRDLTRGVSGVKYRLELSILDEFAIDANTALSRMQNYGDI